MSEPVVIICSRRHSSRIPDKAFKKINGVSAICHILNRLKPIRWRKIIAVPPAEVDDYVFETRIFKDIDVVGGNPDSPLHRMADIVNEVAPCDYVVRITNDDIIIDAQTMLEMYVRAKNLNVTYAVSPGIVEGAGVELIKKDALYRAAEEHPAPTEFITYCVDKRPQLSHSPRSSICRPYRLTMDYPEDAILLETVLREVGNCASVDEICRFLDDHPGLLEINKMPELTIYTCVKDGAGHVADALDSMSKLTMDVEFIVVDDRSEDQTLLNIAPHLKDPRLKVIFNPVNMGLASSSNVAINAARGRYVMRLDADDMIIPGNFLMAWPTIKGMLSTRDIVYPSFYEIDENGNFFSVAVKNPAEKHHAGCAIMNKKFINELRFREGLRHWDGLELMQRAAKHTGFAYCGIPTWLYRQRPNSMSHNKGSERAALRMEILGDGGGGKIEKC